MSKGSVRIGEGSPCAKWARPMDRYGHGAGWKPRPAQPYWFTYWDRCPHCGHIQHYEEAKRFPGGAEGTSKPVLLLQKPLSVLSNLGSMLSSKRT
jgi:hypothetical protein